MTEGTPRYCGWIARDDEGRPRCEHGWAMRTGRQWRCPAKKQAAVRRYNQSVKGKAAKARWNSSPQAREAKRRYGMSPEGRMSKTLYQLTRVRVDR